jgi:predicted small integral membrane protein
MFEWMAWTTPVAVFFICIVLMLVGMTVWEIKSPTTCARAFCRLPPPAATACFIGLLTAAYVNLGFVGISGKLVRVVEPGGRALDLDQLCAVDGLAGPDHAQGLSFGNPGLVKDSAPFPLEPFACLPQGSTKVILRRLT